MTRVPVSVPFRCPLCASEQVADLVAVSRAGGLTCSGCKRRLSLAQVSESIGRLRRPGEARGEPPRARLWA